MHMYYFAALAMLAGFACPVTILFGAGATALHHLALNFILPAAVFPDGADFTRVIFHAVIVVVETGVLLWMVTQLNNALLQSERALDEVTLAHTEPPVRHPSVKRSVRRHPSPVRRTCWPWPTPSKRGWVAFPPASAPFRSRSGNRPTISRPRWMRPAPTPTLPHLPPGKSPTVSRASRPPATN